MPTAWSAVPQATIVNDDDNAPAVQITEQTASASQLQTDIPRSGFTWHCYSAYPTDQSLGTNASGQVTYTITPTAFSDAVHIFTTLGDALSDINGALAAETVYADALPATNEPHRLAVDGNLAYNGNIGGPSQSPSTVAFNGKRLLTAANGTVPSVVTLTPRDGSVTAQASTYSGSASALSSVSTGDGRAVIAITNSDNSVSVFNSTDGDTWTASATGITLGSGGAPGTLSFDADNHRWVLLNLNGDTGRAYFLSSGFAQDQANPAPDPVLALAVIGTVSSDEGLPALIGTDVNGLELARLVNGQWQYDLLSTTLSGVDAFAGLIENGTLYLAVSHQDNAQADFYRYHIGGNADMQSLATLPLFNNADSLIREGNKLLLATSAGLAVSADDGASWTSLLDVNSLPAFQNTQGWKLSTTRINAVENDTALVTLELTNQNGLYGTLEPQVQVALDGGDASLQGGAFNDGMDTAPDTPNIVWTNAGALDGIDYRLAYKMDGSPAVEAISLAANNDSGDDGGSSSGSSSAGGSGGGSGGGGSLPLVVLGGVLLTALRQRFKPKR